MKKVKNNLLLSSILYNLCILIFFKADFVKQDLVEYKEDHMVFQTSSHHYTLFAKFNSKACFLHAKNILKVSIS